MTWSGLHAGDMDKQPGITWNAKILAGSVRWGVEIAIWATSECIEARTCMRNTATYPHSIFLSTCFLWTLRTRWLSSLINSRSWVTTSCKHATVQCQQTLPPDSMAPLQGVLCNVVPSRYRAALQKKKQNNSLHNCEATFAKRGRVITADKNGVKLWSKVGNSAMTVSGFVLRKWDWVLSNPLQASSLPLTYLWSVFLYNSPESQRHQFRSFTSLWNLNGNWFLEHVT